MSRESGDSTETPIIPADRAGLSWPPDQFYWAVIQPPTLAAGTSHANADTPPRTRRWAKSGPLAPGLLADAADQIPVPVEELHAVCTPLASDDCRIVVCAVAADRLRALSPTTVSLTPTAIPSGIAIGAGDSITAGQLNLLVGPFEPLADRRRRTIRHAAAMLLLLALTGLLALGLVRRERHASLRAAAALKSAEQLIREVSPAAATPAQLAAELDQARRIAGVDLEARRGPDAGASLAAILAAWPTDDRVVTRPQALSVGPDGVSISLLIPGGGDPAAFLAAFRPPPGWSLDEPRLVAVESQTRLSLRLTRANRSGRVGVGGASR